MIQQLAKLLGLSETQAAESMHSERAARHVLSRRSAIGLGAVMVASTAFSFGMSTAIPECLLRWGEVLAVPWRGESEQEFRDRLQRRLSGVHCWGPVDHSALAGLVGDDHPNSSYQVRRA